MGWRDFQYTPYMDNMDNITPTPPLNPYYPLIPGGALPESGSVPALPALNGQPLIEKIICLPEKIICLPTPRKPDPTSSFCPKYNGHCSVRIGDNYLDQCVKMNCEYHGLPDVPTKRGIYKLADYCPERADQTTQRTTCRSCGGSDYWLSAVQESHTVCRRCHPPMEGAEKAA